MEVGWGYSKQKNEYRGDGSVIYTAVSPVGRACATFIVYPQSLAGDADPVSG